MGPRQGWGPGRDGAQAGMVPRQAGTHAVRDPMQAGIHSQPESQLTQPSPAHTTSAHSSPPRHLQCTLPAQGLPSATPCPSCLEPAQRQCQHSATPCLTLAQAKAGERKGQEDESRGRGREQGRRREHGEERRGKREGVGHEPCIVLCTKTSPPPLASPLHPC